MTDPMLEVSEPTTATTGDPTSRPKAMARGAKGRLESTATKAREGVKRNPLGMTIGGIGLGTLAGLLAPTSSKEERGAEGPMSKLRQGVTSVRRTVAEVADEASRTARQVELERKQQSS